MLIFVNIRYCARTYLLYGSACRPAFVQQSIAKICQRYSKIQRPCIYIYTQTNVSLYIYIHICNIDIHNISSEIVYNLLRLLQDNSLDLSDENILITLFVNIVGKDNYDTKEVFNLQRDINKSVSELSTDESIMNCSRFITNVGRDVKMLKRFEKREHVSISRKKFNTKKRMSLNYENRKNFAYFD